VIAGVPVMPFVEADNAPIHARVEGQAGAPVVVLSHSLGTSLAMWDPQMPALAERFRVLRYDSRGHGESAVTPGPYTIARLGRDVIALLDGLGIQRVSFCGLSMGGMVGMWLGAHAPERVEKLVLCNTAARIGSPEFWESRIENIRKSGMEPIATAVLGRWFTPGFHARSPDTIRDMRRMLVETSVEGYAACCAAIRDADLREVLSRIQARTLVIAGTHDAATPPADGRFVAEKVQGARYVELAAAHLSNIEAAERFTAEVVAFLSE
jgi:3-oxoadipate enol-lactonase